MMKTVGLNLTKEPGSRKVDLTLTFDSRHPPGMPQCKGAKVFNVLTENSWLTAKGNLVQDSQEHKMKHYEFCVDLIDSDDDDDDGTDERFGAVSCAACTEDHPCVNLCCPHGTAIVEGVNSKGIPVDVCGTKTLNESFSPEFWTEHDMKMEEYGREHGFILKAPSTKALGEGSHYPQFKCPDGLRSDFLHTYPDIDHSRYAVTPDGRLHGYNISYQHQKALLQGNFSWDNDKFCVSYADGDYDYYSDGVFDFTFNACYDDNCPGPSQPHINFLARFNPVSLCISIFFLLLTIAVFIWYKNINAWDRSNMMKIAFMVNLTIAYILSVAMWAQGNDYRGKPGCKLSGYLLQHFFLAAIFWINAMGFHIWRLFNVGGSRKLFREDLKKFLFYALYAQGVPLLITIITAIIDSTRDGARPRSHYPNMGEFRCFLGEGKEQKKEHPHYHESAKFIYMDLFLIIIQFVNGIFLISIGRVLSRGWQNQADMLEMRGEEMESFKQRFSKAATNGTIVIRICVILGVPWVFELISTVISHYHEVCQPTSVRVILFLVDLFVCFAGFFIFLTMVVKKENLKGMKEQATLALSSYGIISPSTTGGDSSMMTATSELNTAAAKP